MLFVCLLLASHVTATPLVHERHRRSGIDNAVYDDTWSTWGPCSTACGGGNQERTLGCRTPNAGYNKACITTSASCSLLPCDDEYAWGTWGECSVDCRQNAAGNGGTRSRTSTAQQGATQIINCNVQNCEKLNGCGKADLLFVLDSSGSVGELNWFRTKQFVLDVIAGLTVEADGTRIGVITFSTVVTQPVVIGQYGSVQELRSAIWSIPYLAGATNTADGLRQLRAMSAQYGREDVKTIVVVVTDGASNVLPDTTIPQAELSRGDAMTIFAIGIGNVNPDELEGIASRPKDYHYHYVEDFEGLHRIVATIVNDTCETANQVVCDTWNAWSACSVSCGYNGVQTRTQPCRMVDFYGSVTKTFTKTEDRSCSMGSCVTSTPRPTPAPTPRPTPAPTSQPTTRTVPTTGFTEVPPPTTTPAATTTSPSRGDPDCSLCEFHDNTGYLQDHQDCAAYIECIKSSNGGGYTWYFRRCAPSLYWNLEYLTCTRTPATNGCTLVATTQAPPYTTDGTTAGLVCPWRQDTVEPSRFYIELAGQNIYQSCGPDGIFDEDSCRCTGVPTGAQCQPDLLLHFPFDDHFNDVTCHRAKADVYGSPVLVEDALRGSVVYFDGSSRLTVSFLHNWFVGNRVDAWSVSFWYKAEATASTGSVGLVNNGDCKEDSSFSVYMPDGATTTGQVDTTDGVMVGNENLNTPLGQWHHVVMVYDGSDVVMYHNGVRQGDGIPQTGFISNRQCPMNIAHAGQDIDTGYFTGFMDELRIYRVVLSGDDVMELYQQF